MTELLSILDKAPRRAARNRWPVEQRSPARLAERLRQFGAVETATRNRLLAALSGARALLPEGALRLEVAFESCPLKAPWLIFEGRAGRAALLPDLINEQAVGWTRGPSPAPLPHALCNLSQLEGLIVALEKSCGQILDPTGLGEPPAFQLRLDLCNAAGVVRHRAYFAVDEELARAWPRPSSPPAVSGALVKVPLEAAIEIPILRLALADLRSLARGDIVLMPPASSGGWRSRFRLGPQHQLGGRYSASADQFTIDREGPLVMSATDDGASGAGTETEPRDLMVNLDARLTRVRLPLRELGALKPGYILETPGGADGPEFELCANGQSVAFGRMVAVGEGFGILIERLAEV